jgi:hypothetical protein
LPQDSIFPYWDSHFNLLVSDYTVSQVRPWVSRDEGIIFLTTPVEYYAADGLRVMLKGTGCELIAYRIQPEDYQQLSYYEGSLDHVFNPSVGLGVCDFFTSSMDDPDDGSSSDYFSSFSFESSDSTDGESVENIISSSSDYDFDLASLEDYSSLSESAETADVSIDFSKNFISIYERFEETLLCAGRAANSAWSHGPPWLAHGFKCGFYIHDGDDLCVVYPLLHNLDRIICSLIRKSLQVPTYRRSSVLRSCSSTLFFLTLNQIVRLFDLRGPRRTRATPERASVLSGFTAFGIIDLLRSFTPEQRHSIALPVTVESLLFAFSDNTVSLFTSLFYYTPNWDSVSLYREKQQWEGGLLPDCTILLRKNFRSGILQKQSVCSVWETGLKTGMSSLVAHEDCCGTESIVIDLGIGPPLNYFVDYSLVVSGPYFALVHNRVYDLVTRPLSFTYTQAMVPTLVEPAFLPGVEEFLSISDYSASLPSDILIHIFKSGPVNLLYHLMSLNRVCHYWANHFKEHPPDPVPLQFVDVSSPSSIIYRGLPHGQYPPAGGLIH